MGWQKLFLKGIDRFCEVCYIVYNMKMLVEVNQEPKHPRIKRQIKQKIISGLYQERIPSLRDLAKEYQANIRTISKAVSALVEEGLLVRGGGNLGFRIRGAEVQTFSIGLIGNRAKKGFFKAGDYYFSIFQGIDEVIQKERAIFSYHFRDNKSRGYRYMFRNLGLVDGILIFLPFIEYKQELFQLARKNFPFIVVGSSFEEPDINYVDSDNVGDSCTAVGSLLAQGHRRIAITTEKLPYQTDPHERLQGYKEAFDKYEVSFDPELVFMGNESKEVDRFLSLKNQPTALFGAFAKPTEHFLSGLKQKAPNFLKELSLVIYDDFQDEGHILGRAYTAVKQPMEEIGRVATQELLALIKGSSAPVKINLSSTLIRKDGRRKFPLHKGRGTAPTFAGTGVRGKSC